MGCTVKELSRRLTSRDLTMWQAFYELEPWGGLADDQRASHVAWAAMFPHVKTKRGDALTHSDVMMRRSATAPAAPAESDVTDEAALERFFQGAERKLRRRR